jgi:hypothetical protein
MNARFLFSFGGVGFKPDCQLQMTHGEETGRAGNEKSTLG